MAKKKKYKTSEEENKVNEPIATYHSLKIFSSFEEAETFQIKSILDKGVAMRLGFP